MGCCNKNITQMTKKTNRHLDETNDGCVKAIYALYFCKQVILFSQIKRLIGKSNLQIRQTLNL